MEAGLTTRIIGLDPGLRITGWGVIEVKGNHLKYIAHGTVTPMQKAAFADRLCQLYTGLVEVLETYHPQEASIEETFVNQNPTSTLKLGMARGVVLLAPAKEGLAVAEYSANHIKKTVTGVGHATKDQIAMMVARLLPESRGVTLDAADALATAICHAHHRTSNYVEHLTSPLVERSHRRCG